MSRYAARALSRLFKSARNFASARSALLIRSVIHHGSSSRWWSSKSSRAPESGSSSLPDIFLHGGNEKARRGGPVRGAVEPSAQLLMGGISPPADVTRERRSGRPHVYSCARSALRTRYAAAASSTGAAGASSTGAG